MKSSEHPLRYTLLHVSYDASIVGARDLNMLRHSKQNAAEHTLNFTMAKTYPAAQQAHAYVLINSFCDHFFS